jgi:hypothetical protein
MITYIFRLYNYSVDYSLPISVRDLLERSIYISSNKQFNHKKIKPTKNKSKQQVTTKFMWHKQK